MSVQSCDQGLPPHRPSGRLEREQPGAPALGRDPRPLGGDDVGGLVRQVAHDLPADGRIGVEQPIDDGHAEMFGHPAKESLESRAAGGLTCIPYG